MKKRKVVSNYLNIHSFELYTIEMLRGFLAANQNTGIIEESIVPENSPLFRVCTTNVSSEYVFKQLMELEGKMAGVSSHDMELLILADVRDPYKFRYGLIVIEWGECKYGKYKNFPALKLICGGGGAADSRGNILLYAYVYLLKKHNLKYGILELAGNFTNMSALCAYNKFGFRENLELKRQDCFGDKGTLPMTLDTDLITYQKLDKILTRNYDVEKDTEVNETSEPLCDKRWKGTRTQQQQILERIKLYNNIENKINKKTQKKALNCKKKSYRLLNTYPSFMREIVENKEQNKKKGKRATRRLNQKTYNIHNKNKKSIKSKRT